MRNTSNNNKKKTSMYHLKISQPRIQIFPCKRSQYAFISMNCILLVQTRSIRVCSFGMIQIWINDPRSLGSWRIKGTDESALGKDLSAPLMRHDPSDLGSLIQIRIIPKERTLSYFGATSRILSLLELA